MGYDGCCAPQPNCKNGSGNALELEIWDLFCIHALQGKAQDAHNMLMAAVSASPTYAEAYNNLGVLQRDVGTVEVCCFGSLSSSKMAYAFQS